MLIQIIQDTSSFALASNPKVIGSPVRHKMVMVVKIIAATQVLAQPSGKILAHWPKNKSLGSRLEGCIMAIGKKTKMMHPRYCITPR